MFYLESWTACNQRQSRSPPRGEIYFVTGLFVNRSNPQRLGMAELVTYVPISSPFIRFAGRYVDEAFGVAAGYNFFVFEAALVPFEVVACNVIIHYWSDIVPAGGIIVIILLLYGCVYSSLVPQCLSRDMYRTCSWNCFGI